MYSTSASCAHTKTQKWITCCNRVPSILRQRDFMQSLPWTPFQMLWLVQRSEQGLSPWWTRRNTWRLDGMLPTMSKEENTQLWVHTTHTSYISQQEIKGTKHSRDNVQGLVMNDLSMIRWGRFRGQRIVVKFHWPLQSTHVAMASQVWAIASTKATCKQAMKSTLATAKSFSSWGTTCLACSRKV